MARSQHAAAAPAGGGTQLLAEITVKAQDDPEPDVLRMLATEFSRASASAQVALAIESAIATAERKLREHR